MPEDEKPGRGLAALAQLLAGISRIRAEAAVDGDQPETIKDTIDETPAFAEENHLPADGRVPAWPKQPQPDVLGNLVTTPTTVAISPTAPAKKKSITHDELAKMILRALRMIDKCPEHGLIVTTYGSNPWSAMLTIRPEVGSIEDGPLWYARAREISLQLRNDFDVIADANAPTGSADISNDHP